jgi:triosephosphate isomerase (TIM)
MRKRLVVGNWKMNLTQAEAVSAVEFLIHKVAHQDAVEVAICPPYTSIAKVREHVKKTNLAIGAQDVFWVDSGAFTGRISAPMLADSGVKFCIVGHSESRGRFGKLDIPEDTISSFAETDRTVNLKLKALLYHNIAPILCVGETLAEREAGRTDEVIREQLEKGLHGIDGVEFRCGVIAYEPVWAIGTGRVCDGDEANRVCGSIRGDVGRLFDAESADCVRVLYGGSVKSSNSTDLFHRPNIDGGLVGGASLDPEEFSRIVMSAA